MKRGKVYLVGAGPGHPDLLTVKAYRLIGEADVIVYDRLVQDECVAHARKTAERIYVGKAPGRHEFRQAEINDILVRKALAGNRLVRLKGGDSLLFSRGGEEAEYLADRGIPFEFIPGVTSALGAPAAAGIPVTHRDLSSSFCVITGHERKDGGQSSKHDWAALTRIDTLAVLMGVSNFDRIAMRLMDHGKSPDTPSAVVQMAFWPGERVLFAPLAEIASRSQEEGIEPPAVLLVGEVVGTGAPLEHLHRDLKPGQGSSPRSHLGHTPGSSVLYPIHLTLEGRRRLEAQFGPEWATLMRMLSDIRPDLLQLGLPAETIAERIGTVLDSEVLPLIRKGQEDEAFLAATRILLPHVG